MLNISLHQLEYVVAVSKCGSIKAASEQLHISQPSLSVAISKVEDHLGKKLFLRTRGKMVSLTNFGRMFAKEAEAVLSDAERLFSSGQEGFPAQRQELVLGCFVDLAPSFIGKALNELQAAFPAAKISFEIGSFSEVSLALRSGSIDMAITYNVGLDARFEKRILRKVGPAAFVAPRNPLSKKMRLTLKEVSDHPLVLSDEGLSVQHFLNLFEAEGLQPEIRHRTRSVEAMRSLAANGAGIGLSYTTPPGSVAYDGEHLVSIPIADKAGEEAVLLVTLAEQTGDHWLRSAADCLIRELA